MSMLEGVVRNDDLLVRWTFDEGNGTVAHDATGNGVDATIYGSGQWGSGISRSALDLTGNSGWAEAGPNDNLKAQGKYSIALWFKSSGSQQGWTQILSKRQDVFSPYFVQFDEDGDSIKIYHRFQADYVNSGTLSIAHGVWNHLASTYDGQKFKSYLNGRVVGSVDETRGISQDNGILGIGGTPGGGDVFEGLIDDVRLYGVALSLEELVVAYGDGMGDFGPSVEINATLATHAQPIPVSIIFRDNASNDANVSGFLETDIQVKGASVQNFSPSDVNASRYQFELIPDRNQTFIFITLPTGVAQDANGDYSTRTTHRINYNFKVTRVEDLVGWWTFDETNGTVAADSSGDANATIFGGASWASGTNVKFGTGALILDGVDDYAMANALIPPDRITRPNDLAAWWTFDEGSGTIASDSSGNDRNGTLQNGTSWSSGRIGNGISFNGAGNDRVLITGYKGITGSNPRTLSAWIKTTDTNGRVLRWGTNTTAQKWFFRTQDTINNGQAGAIRVEVNGGAIVGNTIVTDDRWHHVAAVFAESSTDVNQIKLYVDGVFDGSSWSASEPVNTASGDDVRIGETFQGLIDDVRIYSVGLTNFDISSIYREASGSPLDLGEGDYTISTWFKPAANPSYIAGLKAGGLNGNMSYAANPGNLDSNTANSGATNGIDPLGPTISESKSKPPWKDNWTVVYSGQIYDDDGVMAFQEDIDDKAWLVINSQQILNDTGWNRETSGNTNFGTGGWFDFELRLSNGGGGAGRANAPTGFGWDSTGGTTWVLPRNSNANTADLFRTEEPPNPLVARLGTSADKGLFHKVQGRIVANHALSDGSVETANSSSGISLGEWHHLASVVDRTTGNVKLFVDGVLAGSKSFTAKTDGEYTLTDWYFGSMGSSEFAEGTIDDTRIYSAALSADDIANIYNGGEGDMGLMANFDAPLITNLGVIPVTVNFSRFAEPETVTGFLEGDVTVTGATISNFQQAGDSSSYSFDLTPDANTTRIELSLALGAAIGNSDPSLPASTTILITPPVRKHGDIIGWWWFDDAKGTKATNAVGTTPGELQAGSDWSPDGKFGSAVQISTLGGSVELGNDPGLSSADSFSVSFWFKRNVDSFSWSDNSVNNVMLSLRGSVGSSIEIGTEAGNLEVFLTTESKSELVSSPAGILDNQWHYLSLTYDSTRDSELELYVDSSPLGSWNQFGGKLVVDTDAILRLGIADPDKPSKGRFDGTIDDLRIHRKILSTDDILATYANGNGDLELTVIPSYSLAIHDATIPISLQFYKYGQTWPIIEYDDTLISVNSANDGDHSGTGSSRQFTLSPTVSEGKITVTLPSGLGKDTVGSLSMEHSFEISYGMPVTRADRLQAWWQFEDNATSLQTKDYYGRFTGFLSGTNGNLPSFDSAGKFGQALYFNGDGDKVTVPYNPKLDLAQYTVSIWLKSEKSNDGFVGVFGGPGRRYSFYAGDSNRDNWFVHHRYKTGGNNNVGAGDARSFPHNVWTHVGMTNNASTSATYVNGVLRTTGTTGTLQYIMSSLYFGANPDNGNGGWYQGWLDDVRLYDISFSQSEIDALYGNGTGDIDLKTYLEVDRIVRSNPFKLGIKFEQFGDPVEVIGFEEGDLSFANGSFFPTPGSLAKLGPGQYEVAVQFGSPGQDETINLAAAAAVDQRYGDPSPEVNATTRLMWRSVTRGETLSAWWPFDGDAGNIAQDRSGNENNATLIDSELTAEGRFGQGVRFSPEKNAARIQTNAAAGIDLVANSYTLSAWFKGLYPSTGKNSLFRSNEKPSNRDWDRMILFRGSNRTLCSFDGNDGNGNNRYRSSGKTLDPLDNLGWHHVAVVAKGNRTYFFIDGKPVGSSDRQETSDVFLIGNHVSGEAFAEFLDDVRIYSISLSDTEVSSIYGNGFGDLGSTPIITAYSPAHSTPIPFSVSFGDKAQESNVTGFSISDIQVINGTASDFNGSGFAYDFNVNPDLGAEEMLVTIPSAAANDESNFSTESTTHRVLFHTAVYRETDIISHWTFDEANGSSVRDVGIAHNTSFLRGDAHLATGKFRNALSLDGAGDYAEIPKFRGIYSDGDFTISSWVKLNRLGLTSNADDAGIFSRSGNGNDSVLLWYNVNGTGIANRTFTFNAGNPGTAANRLDGPDNAARISEWQHVACVMNGNERFLYVDGEQAGFLPLGPTSNTRMEGSSIRIGSWDNSGDFDFNGLIDEVRLYDVAFTGAEVAILHGNGFGDIGVVPLITINSPTDRSPISVSVNFKRFGTLESITNFDVNSTVDLQVTGGTIINGNGFGASYTFDIIPNTKPSIISISIPKGAGNDASNDKTSASTQSFAFRPSLTAEENLLVWYPFEELNGTITKDLSGHNFHAEIPQESGLLLYDGFAGYTNNTSIHGKTTTDPSQVGFTTANTWGTGTGTIKGWNTGLEYPVGAQLTPSPGSVKTSYKQRRGLARDFSDSIGRSKAETGIYMTGIVRWVHADMLNTFAGFVSSESNGASTPAWDNLRGALIGFKQDGSNRDLVVRYRNTAGTSSDAILVDNLTMGVDYLVVVKMQQGYGIDKLWAQSYTSSDNYPIVEPTSWTVGGALGIDVDNLDEDAAPIKFLQIWGGDGTAGGVTGGTGSQVDEMMLGTSWTDTLLGPTIGLPPNLALVPGKFGNSISFPADGHAWTDSDKISLAKDMTLSAWTKIHDDNNGIIARNGQFSLQYEDKNIIIAYVRRGGTWTGARARSILGRWAHHAMTYDGNEVKLYLNGIEVASTPATGFLEWGDGADHKLYLGSGSGGGAWMAKVEMDL